MNERFFQSFKLFDRVEVSEGQTKTERRKNYEKEREKKFTDWKHIPCSVCSMDSFDFDCGCATFNCWFHHFTGVNMAIYTITDSPLPECLSFYRHWQLSRLRKYETL